jgi:hypothetical protein
MRAVLFAIGFAVVLLSAAAFACNSDFDCGMGYSCVKEPYNSSGVCMENVDEYGIQQFDLPSLDSVGPRMDDGDCTFDTDCPIGFRCDLRYKVCVQY